MSRITGMSLVCSGGAMVQAGIVLRVGARHDRDEAPSLGLHRQPIVVVFNEVAVLRLEPPARTDSSAICEDAMKPYCSDPDCGYGISSQDRWRASRAANSSSPHGARSDLTDQEMMKSDTLPAMPDRSLARSGVEWLGFGPGCGKGEMYVGSGWAIADWIRRG